MKSDPPEARTTIAETPLQRAKRELAEQQEAIKLEAVREEARLRAAAPKPATYTPRTVQLVLDLHYEPAGTLLQVEGRCGGRKVLDARSLDGVDLGAAAVRTLELGALGALLGS